MISKTKINQLKNYFATQPVDVVYLFGSQANGKATKLSDVDIGVLFKKGLTRSERFDLKLDMISCVCGILKVERVDIVDLEQAPLKFKYQILYSKFTIFVRNKSRMVEFEHGVVKRYLDVQPYLYLIAKRQLEQTAEMGFKNE